MKASHCSACATLKAKGDMSVSNSCGTAIAEAIEAVYKLEGNSIAKQKNNNGSAKPIAVNASNESEEDNGLLPCPQCGEKTLRPEGRCFTCSNCLWTKCD